MIYRMCLKVLYMQWPGEQIFLCYAKVAVFAIIMLLLAQWTCG